MQFVFEIGNLLERVFHLFCASLEQFLLIFKDIFDLELGLDNTETKKKDLFNIDDNIDL